MFQKPYRIKSNTQLRSTERKALKTDLLRQFSHLQDQDLDFMFNKDSLSVCKAILASGENALFYLLTTIPMVFKLDDAYYPTVYFLWECPCAVPSLITHQSVIDRIKKGADLMTPGVTPSGFPGREQYGNIPVHAIVSIHDIGNIASQAVGVTVMSSLDMFLTGGRGKCVKIFHSIDDLLYLMNSKKTEPVPQLGVPRLAYKESSPSPDASPEEPEEPEENLVETIDALDFAETEEKDSTKETMDTVLMYCFLKAVKYSMKQFSYPILVSSFCKILLQACPAGKVVDVKKSSYKKFSSFFKTMADIGIIEYGQVSKGVDAIMNVNNLHELYMGFVVDVDDHKKEPEQKTNSRVLKSTNIEEGYTLNSIVLPLFKNTSLRKGDAITPEVLRQHITNYVKVKKLQEPLNKSIILPNPELANIIRSTDHLNWEELFKKVVSLLGNYYKITTLDGKVITGKGKLDPISMSIATRTGHKKVTIVDNLPQFGINLDEFAKELQHGVAASTSVNKINERKTQFIVQGNQVAFIGKLLLNKYKVPKKFVAGLDLATKKK